MLESPIVPTLLQWKHIISMQQLSLEHECSNIGVIIDPGCAEGTTYTFTEYCCNSILVSPHTSHAWILLLHILLVPHSPDNIRLFQCSIQKQELDTLSHATICWALGLWFIKICGFPQLDKNDYHYSESSSFYNGISASSP